MLLLFAGRAVAFVCVFALPLVVARMFSMEEFGLYRQLLLVHITLLSVLTFGFSASLYYFVPRHLGLERSAYMSQTVMILAGLGLAGAAGLVVFKSSIARALNNPDLETYLPYLAVFTALSLVAYVLEIIMVVLKQAKLAAVTNIGSELVRAMLVIGTALATRSVLAILLAMLVWAGTRLAALLVYLRSLGMSWSLPTRHRLFEQFRYAVPFGFALIVWTLATNLHQYVVSYLYDPALFAIYSVGCLQVPLLAIVFESVSDVTLVRVTELRQAGLLQEAAGLVGSASTKLALVLFPAFVWVATNARDVLVLLYTERFEASVPIFMVFLLMIPLAALELDYIARAFADTAFIFRINLIRLTLSALLLGVMVAPWGLAGAAWATVLALGVTKLVTLRKLKALFGIPVSRLLPWSRLAKIFLIAGVAGAAVWLIPSATGSMGIGVRLLLSGICFTTLYGLLIWSSDLLEPTERQWMIDKGRRLTAGAVGMFNVKRASDSQVG